MMPVTCDVEFAVVFLECADDASAGFILVEPVAFIKNGRSAQLSV